MAEANTIAKDFKAPPTLRKDTLYNTSKKEVKSWKAFTSLLEEKAAPAMFMTLTGETKEVLLGMGINELIEKIGIKI